MFWRNFYNTIRVLKREKILLFWTFAFPIILGLFFNMAFADIEKSDKLTVFDIAIINNDAYNNNTYIKEAYKSLSNNDDNQLFNIKYVDQDTAAKLLDNDEIVGYLELTDDNYKIKVNQSGINQTILNSVTEEVFNTYNIVSDIAKDKITNEYKKGNTNIDYAKIYSDAQKTITDNSINIKDNSSSNLSYMLIEFYTLIAMACLYGGTIASSAMNNNLANMSGKGKRISVAPIPKRKIVLSSLLASYVVQLFGLALLFLFTIFVLDVNYGDNLFYMILLALCGSLAGLSIGIAVSTLLKTNENNKTGILIGITMIYCFLSGMMGVTMKYIIDKNIPILNIINPASMITDGFYSLYYYNTYDRFFFNIISLLVFSFVLITLSYTQLRRQKYDSI